MRVNTFNNNTREVMIPLLVGRIPCISSICFINLSLFTRAFFLYLFFSIVYKIMQIIWYIHTVRFLAFFISLITFVCHLTQCILLNSYQEQVIFVLSSVMFILLIQIAKKTGIPDWITAGHWQVKYLTPHIIFFY